MAEGFPDSPDPEDYTEEQLKELASRDQNELLPNQQVAVERFLADREQPAAVDEAGPDAEAEDAIGETDVGADADALKEAAKDATAEAAEADAPPEEQKPVEEASEITGSASPEEAEAGQVEESEETGAPGAPEPKAASEYDAPPGFDVDPELEELLKRDIKELPKEKRIEVAKYKSRKAKAQMAAKEAEAPKKEEAPEGFEVDPELEKLLEKDIKELPKDQRIAVAKYKSRKAKAQMAAKEAKEEGADATAEEKKKPEAPGVDERALTYPDARQLNASLADAMEGWTMWAQVPCAIVHGDRLLDVLGFAQRALGYEHLACLTAADYDDHLEVVYSLYNYGSTRQLGVKVRLPRDDPVVASATKLWRGADWFEREVYDLFGVRFSGHPDLRRIMMPEGWEGHPLRKDYDLTRQQFIGMDERGEDVVSYREEEGW